jgi:excisionase family DNA binding protein
LYCRGQASGNEKSKGAEVNKDHPSRDRKRGVVIINRPFVSPLKSCDKCKAPNGMVTPDEAASLYEVSTRTIYQWLELGTLHFTETVGEGLLICLSSLASAATNEVRE